MGNTRSSSGSAKESLEIKWLITEEELKYALDATGHKKIVGTGTSGIVYLATYKGAQVAVKLFHPYLFELEEEKPKYMSELLQEMTILASLSSPYIIGFLGGDVDEHYFVTEYMDGGDLSKALGRKEGFAFWGQRGHLIALDVILGLQYLHDNNIIHRDVKSSNILLTSDRRAKITDVGIAKVIESTRSHVTTHTQKYSTRWAAPENFESPVHYSDRTDIYSFGVVLWELLVGQTPWAGYHDFFIYNAVKSGQTKDFLKLPDTTPPRLRELIHRCWAVNPPDRPSAAECANEIEQIILETDPIGLLRTFPLSSALNPKLSKINLNGARVDEDVIKVIVDVLESENHISEISFGLTRLGDELLSKFCSVLGVNKTLRTLDLSICTLTDASVADLALSLQRNEHLKELILRKNMIGDVGAIAISKLMKFNTTIERIDLSENPSITSTGVEAIANAFKINTAILDFEIDPPPNSGESGAEAVELGVFRNVLIAKGGHPGIFYPETTPQMRQTTVTEVYLRNGFHVLPTELSYVRDHLTSLTLSDNKLTSISQYVLDMPNLIVLDVRNNALRMIPSEISQLGKLQCLLLTNNKLESLPVQLVDMESLEVVHIWNNPLSCIPKPHNLYQFHVMRVQDTTLFTHLRRLRSRVQDDMSDITRAKLLLLGEPNCGKGALLQSFLKTQTSASSTLPEATPLSDIQISNLVFKSQDASDVLFTTWNMRYNGPTSPMGAMHTLFATPSTVFCIVFDTRSKDTPRLEYWVASVVRAVGANAKILLVGTFGDMVSSAHQAAVLEKLRIRLQSFPILDIRVVSNQTNAGIEALAERLANIAIKQQLVHSIPKCVLRIEDHLLSIKYILPCISREYLDELISGYSVPKFLCDKVVNFFDATSILLYERNLETLIEPTWLFEFISNLAPSIAESRGILDVDQIHSFEVPATGSFRDAFLMLLQRRALIHPAHEAMRVESDRFPNGRPDADQSKLFAVPALFPTVPTGQILDFMDAFHSKKHSFLRIYRFGFVTVGLLEKLLFKASQHDDIIPVDWWKGGFIIKTKQNEKALVKLNHKGTQCTVHVLGELPSPLLPKFIDMLESLIDYDYNYGYKVIIPMVRFNPEGELEVVHHFPREEIASAIVHGQTVLSTLAGGQCWIETLSPDLCMKDLEAYRIPNNEVNMLNTIVRGGLGAVSTCRIPKFPGETLVAKTYENAIPRDKSSLAAEKIFFAQMDAVVGEFTAEVRQLREFNHPNLVPLKGFSLAPLSVIMPYYPLGTLASNIQDNSAKLTWKLKTRILLDVASGLVVLHEHTPPVIFHGMRPQDILLQSFDSNAPTVAVIAGFGLSRRHLDLQRILHSAKHCNWIAPEVQQGECKAGSTTSDVFSFGMVMWSLLTSQTTPTFSRNGSETPQDAKQAICEGLRPIIPQYDSSAMMEIHWVKLMQRCWSQDPADRLEVNELLAEVKSLAAATTFLQNMYL